MSSYWDVEAPKENSFSIIPDDTKAVSLIERIELKEFSGDKLFSIMWKIIDGEFKGRVIFQKLRLFDESKTKRERAIYMLKSLYLLSNKDLPNGEPNEQDLQILKSIPLSINIREYSIDSPNGGTPITGNWIDEVTSCSSGHNVQPKVATDDIDDDIGF